MRASGPGDPAGVSGPQDCSSADRRARALWSVLTEPGDEAAGALLEAVGAQAAASWVASVGTHGPDWTLLGDLGRGLSVGSRSGLARRAVLWARRGAAAGVVGGELPIPDGLRVVVPGDAQWPVGLDDLGAGRPHCLWVRGRLPTGPLPAVALVGSRACTAYGRQVAAQLAHGVASRGVVVVSGGAFGIDAAAHRGALAASGTTVVLLAGGIDRPYPGAHRELFDEVVATGGALVGEAPPGAAPLRSRFLQRNRLIAAMATATVVVEAAWRSGALSTANHAARLLRPVGAVPGPVTSAASAGCHRLLREGCSVCVTDADDVLELVGPVDPSLGAEPDVGRPLDGLDPVARAVHEALSVRRPTEPADLAAACALSVTSVRASLGRLELAGLAVRSTSGWRARQPPDQD